jgi:parallel beta-helix repeat protein
LRIEPLEDRRMLANVTVGNLNDVVNGTVTSIAALVASNGGDGISLREAIQAANADFSTADTIDFSVTGTIQLTNAGHAGEIVINDHLTINGPGANLLTIGAFAGTATLGDGARILNIQVPIATRTVAISGLTLTGGDAAGGGGAIVNTENLTVTACTITGNRASGPGAGIQNFSGGNLTITLSTISANISANAGGGVHSNMGSLTISQSTVSGNTAGNSFNGGGIHSSESATTIDSSTISGNSAGGSGGIFSENAGITITSSTISGNSARGSGGGLAAFGMLTVRHSTITLNRSDSDNSGGETGGGMSVSAGAVVEHTIVAGNLRSTSTRDDISGTFAARFSLIGDNTGATITDNGGNQIGTGASPIDAKLAALANNGGPTQTHLPLLGSPAVEMGDPAAVAGSGTVPLLDQRGAPFARVADSEVNGTARIDIGAIERPPVAPNFVVDILADEDDDNYAPGDLSLREAIRLAEFKSGVETITFAPALTAGGPASILLTLGELTIAGSMTIQGPGAKLLEIDASGNTAGSRVFNVDDESAATSQVVELNGLTITGGVLNAAVANTAVGIVNNETLRLNRSAVVRNFINVSSSGSLILAGGILNRGSLNIVDSTIDSNGGLVVGGICNLDGTLSIQGSTISNNAGGSGSGNAGGIMNINGTLAVLNSTISRNDGVGIFNQSGGSFGSVVVRHSTIAGNSVVSNSPMGAGIRDTNGAILDHTIVAGNVRFSTGFQSVADDQFGATLAIYSLIGLGAEFLGPLSDNGGPTFTHALMAGSPAIDAGDANAIAGLGTVPFFDQRGTTFGRAADGDGSGGARIDIGALESQFFEPSMLVVDTLADEDDGNYADGDRSLREVISLTNSTAAAETISFAPALTSGGPATIALTQGELHVRGSSTINGPGAQLLSIDASGTDPTPGVSNVDGSRIFRISDQIALVSNVSISGLTLSGADHFAIDNQESLSISGVTVTGNSRSIQNSAGALTVQNSLITANGGTGIQGGGSWTVTGSTISNNLDGGIDINGSGNLVMSASTISGNSSSTGGGVTVNASTAVIRESTISGNAATLAGGGIILFNTSNLTLVNCTVSGNMSKTDGGGIHINPGGSLTLLHSTVTGNKADNDLNGSGTGGGIFRSSGTVSLQHTIVAGNTHAAVADDLAGAATVAFSLLGVNTGATITNNGGNQIGTAATPINPLLGPLANNGGPTFTHALLAGSPAIDAGDPNFDPADPDGNALTDDAVPYDQRGAPFNRVFDGNSDGGTRIDIGAFESGPRGALGDYNQNGIVDAADYTVWRNTLGQMGLTLFSGADGGGDGTIDDDDYSVWKSHFGETLSGAGSGEQGVQVASALAEPVAHVAEDPHPLDNSRPLPEGAAINDALAEPVAATLYDGTALLAANILTSSGSAGASPSRWRAARVPGDSPRDDALVAWVAESAGVDRNRWSADSEQIDDGTGAARGARAGHGFFDGHCLASDGILEYTDAVFELVGGGI